jgi:hypothetical protein
MEAYRGLLMGALLGLVAGCAHEVVLLEPTGSMPEMRTTPLGLTVAVLPGAFDHSRLNPEAVLERFADALREAHLFQGVLYPVPGSVESRWEIELIASDEAFEPGSNFWKSALSSAFPPAALFVKLQNDYALRIEALLLRDRVVVGTYPGEARIRHRYGPYANRQAVNVDGIESAVVGASREALARIREDLPRIREFLRSGRRNP